MLSFVCPQPVALQRMKDHVEVSVVDTGPGIDPKITLFKRFETSKRQGMGLGLSICRTLVEAQGGKLWHDDTKTPGARFCFTVPVAA